jgi:hypothetical protein
MRWVLHCADIINGYVQARCQSKESLSGFLKSLPEIRRDLSITSMTENIGDSMSETECPILNIHISMSVTKCPRFYVGHIYKTWLHISAMHYSWVYVSILEYTRIVHLLYSVLLLWTAGRPLLNANLLLSAPMCWAGFFTLDDSSF